MQYSTSYPLTLHREESSLTLCHAPSLQIAPGMLYSGYESSWEHIQLNQTYLYPETTGASEFE